MLDVGSVEGRRARLRPGRFRAEQALGAWFGARQWFQVGLVWLLSRIWVFAWTVVVAAQQAPITAGLGHPGYLEYVNWWDAGWYRAIHDQGYPGQLPVDDSGAVTENSWAFLPLYPGIVRVVTALTGASWELAAPQVALVASLGFALVAYRLFRLQASHRTALGAVGVLVFAPAGAILQYGYAESVAFLALAAMLYLLATNRYLAAAPVAVLAGLARPMAAPIAVACLAVAGWRIFQHKRADTPMARPDLVRMLVLCLVAVLAVVLWPVVVGISTGRLDGYFLTEAAWQRAGSQLVTNVFFATTTAGFGPAGGIVVGVLVLGLITAALLTGPMRSVGLVMWCWMATWIAYQLCMNGLGRADLRLVLTAFPIALGVVRFIQPRRYWVLLAACAAMQMAWIAVFWHFEAGATTGLIP